MLPQLYSQKAEDHIQLVQRCVYMQEPTKTQSLPHYKGKCHGNKIIGFQSNCRAQNVQVFFNRGFCLVISHLILKQPWFWSCEISRYICCSWWVHKSGKWSSTTEPNQTNKIHFCLTYSNAFLLKIWSWSLQAIAQGRSVLFWMSPHAVILYFTPHPFSIKPMHVMGQKTNSWTIYKM